MRKEKYITKILLVTILIISLATFESLIKAKSIELFEIFSKNTGKGMGEYINFLMFNYIIDILEPLIISLFLVFTKKKLRMNGLIKFVFSAMVLSKLVFKISKFEIYSIFFYFGILLYILLFYFILKIPNFSEGENEL